MTGTACRAVSPFARTRGMTSLANSVALRRVSHSSIAPCSSTMLKRVHPASSAQWAMRSATVCGEPMAMRLAATISSHVGLWPWSESAGSDTRRRNSSWPT